MTAWRRRFAPDQTLELSGIGRLVKLANKLRQDPISLRKHSRGRRRAVSLVESAEHTTPLENDWDGNGGHRRHWARVSLGLGGT